MDSDLDELLSSLSALPSSHEFSIIRLSASLDVEEAATSHASNRSVDDAIASDITTDLAHYKELFSKLRFSYLEQVTKEKFLRAILDDSPRVVEPEENVALETSLAHEKAALRAQKTEVEALLSQVEVKGRDLCQRYAAVEAQSCQARDLPAMMAALQTSVEELRTGRDDDADPSQTLPLPATLALVSERQAALSDIHDQIASLESTLARKTKESELLDRELKPLETQRQNSMKAAEEASRRKAGLGAGEDDLDHRGRWWKTVGETLSEMMQLQARAS